MSKTMNTITPLLLLGCVLLLTPANSRAQERPASRAQDSNAPLPAIELRCPGKYKHHLQGICTDRDSIFWSFTTTLVKTDRKGNQLHKVPVANHHGDLCHHNGKIYVAVNLGKFNDPAGNAQSWIYVYESETLKEIARHAVPEVFHGAGGIGFHNDHFFVVGGLPNDVTENYVYEYDADFKPVKRHVLASGHTHLGIQTAALVNGNWWFGCYGTPQITLVTDTEFKMIGRYQQDCSLGVAQNTDGRLLVASGACQAELGCTGQLRSAIAIPERGFSIQK